MITLALAGLSATRSGRDDCGEVRTQLPCPCASRPELPPAYEHGEVIRGQRAAEPPAPNTDSQALLTERRDAKGGIEDDTGEAEIPHLPFYRSFLYNFL